MLQKHSQKKIENFKHHFQAIIAALDDTFPMHLFDQLLLQVENKLNMLRRTNMTPKISAYIYMNGQHYFIKMPLAPMGCTVLLHNKPDNRKSWAAHASKEIYIKTSREHYRYA